MIKLVRHRIISNTIRKTLENEMKILRHLSSKDDKPKSLCAEKPPDPPCEKPDPPPCPPPPPPCGPPCPPPICSAIPDPNNPCNYVYPEDGDPDEPDMTKIKKKQCFFQQDDDIPIYLKGKSNAYFFQFVTLLGAFTLIQTMISLYGLMSK